MNKYKCPKCGKIVERNSIKQWIKSYCDDKSIYSRLILIK